MSIQRIDKEIRSFIKVFTASDEYSFAF